MSMRLFLTVILWSLVSSCGSISGPTPVQTDSTIELFDSELSQWEVWIGVPHTTVEGLPPGTPQNDSLRQGTVMGVGNDPKNVFSMIEEGGKQVLRVSGEIYGGVNTYQTYANYYLSVYFKWGEKKWEPRLDVKRDSGILYHARGRHGAFAKSWKASLEYQVQEKDMGDFIGLSGPQAKIPISYYDTNNKQIYDPENGKVQLTKRYTSAASEPDFPNGEWNHLEIYVLGDSAVHVVNGEVVLALHDAVDREGKTLASGQIQLQSEGALCYYRDMELTPINDVNMPDTVAALLENP